MLLQYFLISTLLQISFWLLLYIIILHNSHIALYFVLLQNLSFCKMQNNYAKNVNIVVYLIQIKLKGKKGRFVAFYFQVLVFYKIKLLSEN